jgi:hypothetical protein
MNSLVLFDILCTNRYLFCTCNNEHSVVCNYYALVVARNFTPIFPEVTRGQHHDEQNQVYLSHTFSVAEDRASEYFRVPGTVQNVMLLNRNHHGGVTSLRLYTALTPPHQDISPPLRTSLTPPPSTLTSPWDKSHVPRLCMYISTRLRGC